MGKIDKKEILAKDILIKHLRLKGCTSEHIHVGAFISCIDAMEEYARMKNKDIQFALNILTPTSKKTLKCDCEEPIPNYPEMVWCDRCGYEISEKRCSCGGKIKPTNITGDLECEICDESYS